jgi:hypothetical protein
VLQRVCISELRDVVRLHSTDVEPSVRAIERRGREGSTNNEGSAAEVSRPSPGSAVVPYDAAEQRLLTGTAADTLVDVDCPLLPFAGSLKPILLNNHTLVLFFSFCLFHSYSGFEVLFT